MAFDILEAVQKLRDAQKAADNPVAWACGYALDAILQQYGWHDVSEPPTETACYFVTIEDKRGNYVAMAHWDPRHYSGDGWQVNGVMAWAHLFETYKPEVTT